MTPKIQHYLVEKHITHLSLSVLPIDHFVPETYPIGDIKITIEKAKMNGIKNISGFYTFTNLEDGEYTVSVYTDYYLLKEFKIQIPSYGSPPGGWIYSEDEDIQLQDYRGVILATAALRPKPSYPFPAGSNLIRGIVYDPALNPVSHADVKMLDKSARTVTTEKGEFALYLNRLTQYDVIKIDGKKFVRGNGNQVIKIEAKHPDFGTSPQVSLELVEGTTTCASIYY